jgi:hypothetical protein
VSLVEGLSVEELRELGWGPEEVYGEREQTLFCSCPPDAFCPWPVCPIADGYDEPDEARG